MIDLKGKHAVVTGSTSGIGLGVAEALAASGASVTLNGFGDADAIEATRAKLAAEHNVTVRYDGADMSDAAQVTNMIETATELTGCVDILVNNAGIQHVSPIEDFPADRFEAIMAINMTSNWYAIRAALPGMKSAGWGRIVNIASAHGLTASPFKSAYVMAKHGVVGLTKTVALEVAENKAWDITANAICPGYVATPLVENQLQDQMQTHGLTRDEVIAKIMLGRQPQGQFVTTEELGGLTVFLCGPHAGKITGTAISVDGGWTAL